MVKPRQIAAKNNPFAPHAVVADASFSIGVEGGNAIIVSIQLKDSNGNDIDERAAVHVFLSSDANGDTVPTVPTGAVAAGTDGTIIGTLTTKLCFFILSEADGDIDLSITDSGTPTFYAHVILPNGTKKSSSAITFA